MNDAPLTGEFSIMNPVSFDELSVQFNLMEVELLAEARRSVGSSGFSIRGVVTLPFPRVQEKTVRATAQISIFKFLIIKTHLKTFTRFPQFVYYV